MLMRILIKLYWYHYFAYVLHRRHNNSYTILLNFLILFLTVVIYRFLQLRSMKLYESIYYNCWRYMALYEWKQFFNSSGSSSTRKGCKITKLRSMNRITMTSLWLLDIRLYTGQRWCDERSSRCISHNYEH